MSNYGLYYNPNFLNKTQTNELLTQLQQYSPIWEKKYLPSHPEYSGLSPEKKQQMLLRPVYWIGNWQFAGLGYYHPPKGILNRCVQAEPFTGLILELKLLMEELVRAQFDKKDLPVGWHLNTCLVNYYGSYFDGKNWSDQARVGEHKDFEPGPVTSISLGNRALFQFVKSDSRNSKSTVVLQEWLEDGSLQIFGSERFKKKLFHRVQRVEDKIKFDFKLPFENYKTRRINLTFRFVPKEHILPLMQLPLASQTDLAGYIETLSKKSNYWQQVKSSCALNDPSQPK